MERTTGSQSDTSHSGRSPQSEKQRNSDALLDYEGAATPLNCSPRMVRKLVETRQIDFVRVGKLVRIEPAAIARYIERRRVEAVS